MKGTEYYTTYLLRYFLTDDEPIKRKEIVTICQNEFKKPVRNPYFPLWLLRIMAGGKMADSSTLIDVQFC